ncbi:hypothetical protein C8Q80DRAFT_324262 [Daedaleopsis nitida]|nr:hypothetical protein C8Q80DRAFT_324262 [Daedaleopsis nitida]
MEPLDVGLNSSRLNELLLPLTPSRDVELKDHVRDVFMILSSCMTLSEEKLRPLMSTIIGFMIVRTSPKLIGRLRFGRDTWGGSDPIRIIYEKWTSTPLPPEASNLNKSLVIKHQDARDQLQVIGVPQGSGQNTFLLNATTAGKWAQVLLNALEGLEAEVGVGDDNREGSFDRARLYKAMVVLEQFVSSNALAHLLPNSVATEIYAQYKFRKELENQQELAEPPVATSGESSPEPGPFKFTDDEDRDTDNVASNAGSVIDEDEVASITSEDTVDVTFKLNERSVPVIRYAEALAIPLSASMAILSQLARYQRTMPGYLCR